MTKKTDKRLVINWILGFLYSVFMVFGYCAQKYGEVRLKNVLFYLAIVVLTVFWALILKYSWQYLEKRKSNEAESSVANKNINLKDWSVFSLIICGLYFIVFLGVYPGFFCYDAQDELIQTITRSYNTQHPLLHVLAMGGVVQAGHKVFGEYNLAIACFILFQMVIISIVLGYIVTRLKSNGLGMKKAIIISIYFGAFPVMAMYALCSSKDGLFGAFLLLQLVFLYRILKSPESACKRDFILLTVFSVLMMLLRNNGVYAFVVFGFFWTVIYFLNAGMRQRYSNIVKRLLIVFIVSIVCFGACDKTMKIVSGAESVGHRELLTVPIQQLARLYCYDNNVLSTAEKNEIERYIPSEVLFRYNPKCSDMVKIGFDEDAFLKDKEGFFKIWILLGLKHPAAYISSWVMTSYGMYYPWAVIDGYKGNEMFTYTYADSSYFSYEVEPPGERHSLIPVIDKVYKWISLDVRLQKMPIVHLLFSPGFMFFGLLFGMGFYLYSKESVKFQVLCLALIVLMTCLIGPMSLVRYGYYLWILVPVVGVDIFNKSFSL